MSLDSVFSKTQNPVIILLDDFKPIVCQGAQIIAMFRSITEKNGLHAFLLWEGSYNYAQLSVDGKNNGKHFLSCVQKTLYQDNCLSSQSCFKKIYSTLCLNSV